MTPTNQVVFIGSTDLIASILFPTKYDKHVQDWKWHQFSVQGNPNYQADIAARQAAKRAGGIGPDGLCHA